VGAGYGRACLAGAEAAGDTDILVFMDGDGADDPSAIEDMVSALRSGRHDFVIGSRARGKRGASSMAGHQILAGIFIGWLIRLLSASVIPTWPSVRVRPKSMRARNLASERLMGLSSWFVIHCITLCAA
jgi:glycosyltransferase involved in cell wall biosynthesis